MKASRPSQNTKSEQHQSFRKWSLNELANKARHKRVWEGFERDMIRRRLPDADVVKGAIEKLHAEGNQEAIKRIESFVPVRAEIHDIIGYDE
jgi:hypothetical protein